MSMEFSRGGTLRKGRSSNSLGTTAFIVSNESIADIQCREEIAEIEEPCAHDVQFGGMCVVCGKDMTEYAYQNANAGVVYEKLTMGLYRRSYNTNQLDSNRAKINMVHDQTALTVSENEATKVEEEAKRRLIASKKLSLVVDLDQTIIHATVDPTVAQWQKDPENPNYEAVKEVRAFQLIDDGPGARGCWYYIKLRPGLKDFLDSVSTLYELHIYTMGTRAYAQNIANLIDPDRRIFGDRILSRDESGSLVAKNLQRLFPVDTKMVVIIDDRGDVWKWNENLIKVTPYDFFVGIGDINSSFLPKKPKIRVPSKAEIAAIPDPNKDLAPEATTAEPVPATNGTTSNVEQTEHSVTTNQPTLDNNVSALEQLVSMGGGDDPNVLLAQTNKQDEALAAQVQDRPLLQKQEQLDAEDDAEAAKVNKNGDGNHTPPDSEKPHHRNLLHDDDEELLYLEQSLRKIHTEFFDTYARKLADAQGGRLAELRGTQSAKRKATTSATPDLAIIPDVKTIMPAIKSHVLGNVVIVFSGVVPLGTDIQSSDIALWAKSFGARVEEDVSRRTTTHVIAARNRTAKVRQAVRRGKGRIKVVSTKWLTDSISQWKRQDEAPYLLKIDDGEAGRPGPGEEDDILSESEEIDSVVDTDTDLTENEGSDRTAKAPRLTLKTAQFAPIDEEDVDGVMPDKIVDDKSPVGGTNDDWQQMHDELDEFLGSDADDSDADSVASDGSTKSRASTSTKGRRAGGKRSHDQMAGGAEDGGKERKKISPARVTGLSLSQVNESGLPTPDGTAGEDAELEEGVTDDGDGAREGDDDGWGDFNEDDLEEAMEQAAEDEEGGDEG